VQTKWAELTVVFLALGYSNRNELFFLFAFRDKRSEKYALPSLTKRLIQSLVQPPEMIFYLTQNDVFNYKKTQCLNNASQGHVAGTVSNMWCLKPEDGHQRFTCQFLARQPFHEAALVALRYSDDLMYHEQTPRFPNSNMGKHPGPLTTWINTQVPYNMGKHPGPRLKPDGSPAIFANPRVKTK